MAGDKKRRQTEAQKKATEDIKTFRLPENLRKGMEELERDEKLKPSEQARQAIRMWLEVNEKIEIEPFPGEQERDDAKKWIEVKGAMKTGRQRAGKARRRP